MLFAEKCASCHSIGKGDRVGPDLKNVHERRADPWLTAMIATPGKMLNSDADARELLKKYNNVRMPELGLDQEQTASLVELIKRCSVETCNLAGVFRAVTESTPADAELGRQLFVGETAFAAGGPPCVSCHAARGIDAPIAGGTLAKDLTHVFARLGDEGLDGAIKNPAFPLMTDIYAKNKIDKDEAFALRSFLSASNRATSDGDSISVFLAAVVGTVFCLFILNLFWRRRLRGVRKPMLSSQGVPT
jgi:mono/diheme cytochrome c family protein